MIIAYSCFAIAWIGFFLSWDEMTALGRVLFAIIAVATITLVRDAHKRRQEARTGHYSDYIREDHCDSPNCYCAGPYELEGMDEWLATARKRFPNTQPSDLIGFSYDAGEPTAYSPYSFDGEYGPGNFYDAEDADGCTDPKTSSRKRESFLSDFYEFCEENGYSQEERPLVFQEWVNDSR